MRKCLLVLLTLFTALTLSASVTQTSALGGAILTSRDTRTAFEGNPAALADQGFFLEFPVSLQVGHISDIVSSGLLDHMDGGAEELLANSLEVLRSFSGEMELLGLSTGLSLDILGVGASIEVEGLVDTRSGSVGIGLVPVLGGILSLGFGHSWQLEKALLSAGFIQHLSLDFRSAAIDVETLVDIIMNPEKVSDLEMEAVFTPRLDLGLRADFDYGFTTGLVVRIEEKNLMIDGALGWKSGWKHFPLSFELGLKDINHTLSATALMKNLNASASLGLASLFTVNAGLSGGYPALGAELRLFCITVSAAWWWEDYGIVYGLAPRDNLAIEISILFD